MERERWLALDLFRGSAVLWMIQGHTFTALLAPRHYTGSWVQLYSLLHGLTAPMFLSGAGLAYGTLAARADTPARSAALRARLLRRALTLFAIGTLLQLPAAPPGALLRERELLAGSLRLGALQLVAACLLAAELLRALTAGGRRFALALALACLALALCAPWVWQARPSERALLGTWLDGHGGSLFPFVPWACFFLGAAVLTALRPGIRPSAASLALSGLLLSGVCYGLFLAGHTLRSVYGEHAFWHTNPLFLGFRAGLCALWLGVLGAAEPLLQRTAALAEHNGVLRALARHSLVAYVVHLLVLYGTPLWHGLARGTPSWDWPETWAALLWVLGVTTLVTWGWSSLQRAPRAAWTRVAGALRW